MTDVKEIFTSVLETPQPPLLPGDAIVRTVRRTVRRSRAIWAGLATVTVLAGSFAWTAARWGAPDASVTASPSGTESMDPQREEMYLMMSRMSGVVTRALPPGVVADGPPAGEGARDSNTNALTVIGAIVGVEKDGEHGQVIVYWLAQPGPAPSGDLCGAPWPENILAGDSDLSCATLDVAGNEIRAGARSQFLFDGQSVSVPYAIRYLDGALVIVAQQPTIDVDVDPDNDYVDHPLPMLTSPIFSPQEFAALAADPRLIP